MHGGSLRVYATHKSRESPDHAEAVGKWEKNDSKGYHTAAPYEQLATAVKANRESLLAMLNTLKSEGKTIAAYGASAKGNTLLNYCGIDTDLVEYIVTRIHSRWVCIPRVHIYRLEPVSILASETPDYLLITAMEFRRRDHATAGGLCGTGR